jgi:ribosomal protein S11
MGEMGYEDNAVSDREQLATELQHMIQYIRNHVPDAVINTRLAHGDQNGIVIHAQIMGGSGAAGAAHASAPYGDGAAELAENRAIERAMIAMGIPPIPEATSPRLHSVAGQEQGGRVVPFPAQEPERADATPDEPAKDQSSGDDPEPEDISWTAFWTWARANGFANRDALEEAIGQTINQLTPGQIRKLAQDVLKTR